VARDCLWGTDPNDDFLARPEITARIAHLGSEDGVPVRKNNRLRNLETELPLGIGGDEAELTVFIKGTRVARGGLHAKTAHEVAQSIGHVLTGAEIGRVDWRHSTTLRWRPGITHQRGGVLPQWVRRKDLRVGTRSGIGRE